MNVLKIFPRDFYTHVELSLTQVNSILDYLDRCTFDPDKKPGMADEAKKYVENDFFKQLDKLSEEMKQWDCTPPPESQM